MNGDTVRSTDSGSFSSSCRNSAYQVTTAILRQFASLKASCSRQMASIADRFGNKVNPYVSDDLNLDEISQVGDRNATIQTNVNLDGVGLQTRASDAAADGTAHRSMVDLDAEIVPVHRPPSRLDSL